MPHFPDATGPRDPSPDEPGAQPFVVDGEPWVAVCRHEMTHLARRAPPAPRLLLHLFGPGGAHLVVEAPEGLSTPADPDQLAAALDRARTL